MRMTFWQAAAEHERYAPHAFDRLIGQEAPFNINGEQRGSATVVAVAVDEDGSGATWTVDIDDALDLPEHPDLLTDFTWPMSFRFTEVPERWWE